MAFLCFLMVFMPASLKSTKHNKQHATESPTGRRRCSDATKTYCSSRRQRQQPDMILSLKCLQPAVPAHGMNHSESDSFVMRHQAQRSGSFTEINLNSQWNRNDLYGRLSFSGAQFQSLCHLADTFIRWLTRSWTHAWTLRSGSTTHSAAEDYG